MKTIALRFGETFAPKCGTIKAHQNVIDSFGHVWYGKMGNAVSDHNVSAVMENNPARILLIHSGGFDRYWAYVSEIIKSVPPKEEIPEYYRGSTEKFKTWFKVTKFEKAPKDIMSKCTIVSSGAVLGMASRHSMSPYFFINYNDE